MLSVTQSRPLFRAIGTLVIVGSLAACGSSSSGTTAVEPPVTGTIALTLLPGSLSVAAGSTGSVGLSISRGGDFAGAVLLAAAGVPAGVSLTFGSSTVAAGVFSTSVNVSVAAGTVVPSTPITIVGTGSGLTSPAVTLTFRTL